VLLNVAHPVHFYEAQLKDMVKVMREVVMGAPSSCGRRRREGRRKRCVCLSVTTGGLCKKKQQIIAKDGAYICIYIYTTWCICVGTRAYHHKEREYTPMEVLRKSLAIFGFCPDEGEPLSMDQAFSLSPSLSLLAFFIHSWKTH
jgi:hypothetical protein